MGLEAVVTAGGLRDIQEMCQKTLEMLRLTGDAFRTQEAALLERIARLGREVHRQEKTLTAAMAPGPAAAGGGARDYWFVPMHLERVGDNLEALVGAIRTMRDEGVPFTDRAVRELSGLFERAGELLECVRDAMITGNRVLIRYVTDRGTQFAQLADDYALAHQQRLIEGVCMPRASSVYLAMLDYLKGVESHTRQIAQKLAVDRPA